MEGDHIKTYDFLLPLSWLYGLGVSIRNFMFECGLLKSRSYNMPVICIGNITVGGTGKTPHTEYMIRLLSDMYRVAVLSRGYKRKSRGFVKAEMDTPMPMIGDEPYQMKHKFPNAVVAVDRDRCHGIDQLIRSEVKPPIDVILLDDAFQHRYVQAGLNIVLMDYHRLTYFDKLLPAGRLREPLSSMQRADIIIITKCPDYITPMEERGISRSLNLATWQRIFFSTFEYGALRPLYPNGPGITDKPDSPDNPVSPVHPGTPPLTLDQLKSRNVILLTGIASPQQMEYDLKKIVDFTPLHFSDHHDFSKKNIATIEQTYNSLEDAIIITTDKDASRLIDLGASAFSPRVAASIYVLPIEVVFMRDSGQAFDKLIKSFVTKNSRTSTLYQ